MALFHSCDYFCQPSSPRNTVTSFSYANAASGSPSFSRLEPLHQRVHRLRGEPSSFSYFIASAVYSKLSFLAGLVSRSSARGSSMKETFRRTNESQRKVSAKQFYWWAHKMGPHGWLFRPTMPESDNLKKKL